MNFTLNTLQQYNLKQNQFILKNVSLLSIQEIFVLTKRLFIQLKRRPITLVSGIIQPLLWLILFGSLFQKTPINIWGFNNNYIKFFFPGIIVFTAFAGALNASLPLIFDREFGFLNRLLIAPLESRFSILLSSALFICVLSLIQVFFIIIFGIFLGAGLPTLTNFLVSLSFIFLLIIGITTWGIMLALVLPSHIELIAIIFIINLPLLFASTALAPINFMPFWLQGLACLNPLTYTIEPIRFIYSHIDWSITSNLFKLDFLSIDLWQSFFILVIFNLISLFIFKLTFKKFYI